MNIVGIPKRFEQKTLGNFEMIDQREKVMEAVAAVRDGQSVFLSGVPGAGKTHIAVGLLYLKFKQDRDRCLRPSDGSIMADFGDYTFLPSVELFLELKASFSDRNSTEDSVLTQYTSAQFLVIDDVGAEKVSDWSRQMFYTLIDRLYRYEKQVVVTSNLSIDQISSLMDDRISSRLAEMGSIIELNPVDYRIGINAARKQVGTSVSKPSKGKDTNNPSRVAIPESLSLEETTSIKERIDK
jgi:DNA replication protein DnaC